jgi:hypothetical protein
MKLLDVLNNRYSIAKKATDKHTQEVKKCVEDYNCEKEYASDKDNTVYNKHLAVKRYEFPIPYIYSTHESMMASLFDKAPELIISGKGAQDEEKAELMRSIYKYLWDKLDLEDYLHTAAWWFLLTGFVSAYQSYSIETKGSEEVYDSEGQPMMDDMGEPLMQNTFKYHDPVAYIDDPMRTFYAPDSEFDVKGANRIPYLVREKLMEKTQVARQYEISEDEIQASEELKISGYKANTPEGKDDIKRVRVMYYCGQLPKDVAEEVDDYSEEAIYYVVHTTDKILSINVDNKYTTLAKWFGSPNDFFGFGIGKTLRSVQKEMSIRRGQQVRYADLYAFPWLTIEAGTQLDPNALQDVQKRKPLVYTGTPPQFIVPPTMPATIVNADQIARSDAQFISGTLDLSKGAQETNTVKTATGQQLFAQSADKRINKARKALGKFFKYSVINLFKLCADNWEEGKIITITDEEGMTNDIPVDLEMLKTVDFDTDIDISLDNIMVNENTLAERAIALYDKIKDDPMVDRQAIFVDFLLKKGFRIKNPEKYITQQPPMGEGMEDMPPIPEEGQAPAGMPPMPQATQETGMGTNIPDLTPQSTYGQQNQSMGGNY